MKLRAHLSNVLFLNPLLLPWFECPVYKTQNVRKLYQSKTFKRVNVTQVVSASNTINIGRGDALSFDTQKKSVKNSSEIICFTTEIGWVVSASNRKILGHKKIASQMADDEDS